MCKPRKGREKKEPTYLPVMSVTSWSTSQLNYFVSTCSWWELRLQFFIVQVLRSVRDGGPRPWLFLPSWQLPLFGASVQARRGEEGVDGGSRRKLDSAGVKAFAQVAQTGRAPCVTRGLLTVALSVWGTKLCSVSFRLFFPPPESLPCAFCVGSDRLVSFRARVE